MEQFKFSKEIKRASDISRKFALIIRGKDNLPAKNIFIKKQKGKKLKVI